MQTSVAVANARLDAFEAAVGASGRLQMWGGAIPASTTATPAGAKLVEIALAADWMAPAANRSKSLSGVPLATTALAAAGAAPGTTITFYRFTDTAGTTCHWQGPVTATGAGGEMTVDNPTVVSGQALNVTGYTIAEGGA